MYHFGTIFLSFNSVPEKFSYHSILFQKMEMSSPGEDTFFAKKIVHLSFLPFLFQEMQKIINPVFQKYPPALTKILSPPSHPTHKKCFGWRWWCWRGERSDARIVLGGCRLGWKLLLGVTKFIPLKIRYPGVITPITPLPRFTRVITPGVTCFCGAQKCYPSNKNYPELPQHYPGTLRYVGTHTWLILRTPNMNNIRVA